MARYKCIIAPISDTTNEETVIIEADDKAIALVLNCQARPGTYVKSVEEIAEE